MECVIIAGGEGTRLRGVIGEQPKCMAPINGKPFLSYLMQMLVGTCSRMVLSLGYKAEEVITWIEENKSKFPYAIKYVVEQEPLGTGGGLMLALCNTSYNNIAVFNGDTLFLADLQAMLQYHSTSGAATTIALKPMKNFNRYGSVVLSEDNTVIAFTEKRPLSYGLINGGVYVIDKTRMLANTWPQKFSFEADYLQMHVASRAFKGFISDDYFLDIGIPEDYSKAQTAFKSLFP